MRDFRGFAIDKYLFVQLNTSLYLAYDSEQERFIGNVTYPDQLKEILGSCTVVPSQFESGINTDLFALVQLGGYTIQNPRICQQCLFMQPGCLRRPRVGVSDDLDKNDDLMTPNDTKMT